jgi:hypothetical protein
MSVEYQLRVYSPAGALQHIIGDLLTLAYVREVNSPGVLTFDLPAGHLAIDDFERDSQIEVWRQDLAVGLSWSCDFYGFWRGEQRSANADGAPLYRATCVGQMDLLRRAVVAYRAATANRSEFTSQPAETIAKRLVTYNATSSGAVADGRVRNVTLSGIVLQGDAANGPNLTMRCAWRNLLEVLKDLAELGGGDYDLVKTSAAQWEFRWYNGQLGLDRTSTVRFALNYGNMANPVLHRDYSREPTVAIVGGQGADASREIVVRTGANYYATHNAVETFVDARNETATAALEATGDVELSLGQARADLSFDVLQVPQTYYGLHYMLGDLVKGIYDGFSATKQVRRVSVSVADDGSEKIKVDLKDV